MKKGLITQKDYTRIARNYEGGCEGQESFFAENELAGMVDPGCATGVRGGRRVGTQWVDPDEVPVSRRQRTKRSL